MSLITYLSDKIGLSGLKGVVHGSDGRLNVSARADSRAYYNSRDAHLMYSLVFDDAACSPGDFVVSLFNTDTAHHLVVRSVGINASAAGGFKLHRITDASVAGGGAVAATPVNLNLGEESAVVTASTVANSDSSPISGLTSLVVLDHASVVANGHEEFRLDDTLRMHRDQGIAIEYDSGSNATNVFGVIFFYFEP